MIPYDELLHRHAKQFEELRLMVEDAIGKPAETNERLKQLLFRLQDLEREAWLEYAEF